MTYILKYASFSNVKVSYKAVILLKKKLVINKNHQKQSGIQRRDCKIQRGIVKYYTVESVGRARQGFVRKKCIVSGFFMPIKG